MLSKSGKSLFSPVPSSLLKHVIEANYLAASQLASADPALLFTCMTAKDINDERITMTPLEYACYVADFHMVKLFHKVCERHKDKYSQGLEQFGITLEKQTRHMGLDNLQHAYENYLKQFDAYINKEIDLDTLKQAWLKVGLAQRHYLPRYLLKSMCLLSVNFDCLTHEVNFIETPPGQPLEDASLHKKLMAHQDEPVILVKMIDGNTTHFWYCTYDVIRATWVFYEKKNPVFQKAAFHTNQLATAKLQAQTLSSYKPEGYWDWFPWQSMHKVVDYNYPSVLPAICIDTQGHVFPLDTIITDKLGLEGSLARGSFPQCMLVETPIGESGFLKYKAEADWNVFKHLHQRRLYELQDLCNSLPNYEDLFLTQHFEKILNI